LPDHWVVKIGEWRPVVAVTVHGRVLGVTADGSWVLGGESIPLGPAAEPMRLMALLPILEQPYPDVAALVAAAGSAVDPPWRELLALALQWPTESWPSRALGWVEGGYPVAAVLDLLVAAKDAPGRSQPFRHRALRLARSVAT